MFIDTHTHLYLEEFNADRSALIKRAISNGIDKFYLPAIDASSHEDMLKLEAEFPDHCIAMMGLHPCSVKENYESELALVRKYLDERKFAAVGEIGIDLYWDKTFIKEQEIAFRKQIDWALEFNYPIVIHCRSAFNEIYSILNSYTKLPKAIFHCFSGNTEEAKKIIDLGNFKLGIGGVVTFKNSGLDKVVEEIELEHLVLETDAPYLAPVPFRGKRNEPSYLLEVARKIAQIKDVSTSEVGEISSKNAAFIFG